ncbi:MAG: RsmD family RNA methyltransferase [Puniceicoccales bacterium]|jgi:16S rRNA (guanine966-N2)-methyltransferase|nr:RsmD family RNA methyltransferase [Puniceicoccales bacterium]
MKIAGGLARGIVLKNVKNGRLRPATGYLREAIFSSLGDCVIGSRFLDLFAGTGSYGLEALSRGANSGIFVENSREIAVVLEGNLAAVYRSMGVANGGCVWIRDALRVRTEEKFDLIFIDPPYDLSRAHGDEILARGLSFLQKSERSRLIFEVPADVHLKIPNGVRLLRRVGGSGRNSPAAVIYA